MAFLGAAPTWRHHTEQSNGILTYSSPNLKREGGTGKTKAQTGMQTASYCNNTLQRTARMQLRKQVTRCPCHRHRATPSIAGETADQHCFKVNFA
mgnify:CR=1 FL=1